MKYCTTCETEKPKNLFGKRKASKDGLAARCRACQRVYDKARSKDPYRAEARKIYAQTEEGKAAGNKAKSAYRKRFPTKSKAHAKVGYAIRAGNLFKEPCEVCGSNNQIHAHHDDYSKPLNIRWFCPQHHRQWHNVNGEGLNAK